MRMEGLNMTRIAGIMIGALMALFATGAFTALAEDELKMVFNIEGMR